MKKYIFLLFLSVAGLSLYGEDFDKYRAIYVNHARFKDPDTGRWSGWQEWELLPEALPIEIDWTDPEDRVIYFYREDEAPEYYRLRYAESRDSGSEEVCVFYFRALSRRNDIVDIEFHIELSGKEYYKLFLEYEDRAVAYALLPEELYKEFREYLTQGEE